jgi:hypothetical protein
LRARDVTSERFGSPARSASTFTAKTSTTRRYIDCTSRVWPRKVSDAW